MNNIESMEHIISKAKAMGCEVKENEPLSKFTTFKIGGKAAAVITTNNIGELAELLSLCKKYDVRRMVIGNGSNLLVCDDGYDGIVLKLDGDFKNITVDGTTIKCGSGASLASVCTFARDNGLGGLEFAWGIPGTGSGQIPAQGNR